MVVIGGPASDLSFRLLRGPIAAAGPDGVVECRWCGCAGDDRAVSQLTGSVTPPWHALAAEEVTGLLEVDPRIGLSSAEGARRLEPTGTTS